MAFIYILHFDHPLHHAEHYTGCTENLGQRLATHAAGHGSQLTRYLHTQGLHWKLGGLAQCSHRRMRELERGLKDQHNIHRYCTLCQPPGDLARRYSGTTPYDLDLVPFTATSQSLSRPHILPDYTDAPTDSNMHDILLLMRADKDALGFIPVGGSGGLSVLRPRGQIIVATTNDHVIGYLTYTARGHNLTIHQCCVADGERFRGIGRELVSRLRNWKQPEHLSCSVREDLAANHFWVSLGFKTTDFSVHATSGKRLNHYTLPEPPPCLIMQSKTAERTALTATANASNLPTSPPASPKK